MPTEYAYYGAHGTIVISILAMLVALIAVWIKDNDAKGILTVVAVILSVGAGYGWYSNTYEILDIRNRMYNNLKRSEDEAAKQKSDIAALTPYQSAFERVVQSALATPPKGEGGDRTIFQAVMLNIPTGFPNNIIQRGCGDRNAIKDALDPLVTQGKIFAGSNRAWDALLNCALITSTR